MKDRIQENLDSIELTKQSKAKLEFLYESKGKRKGDIYYASIDSHDRQIKRKEEENRILMTSAKGDLSLYEISYINRSDLTLRYKKFHNQRILFPSGVTQKEIVTWLQLIKPIEIKYIKQLKIVLIGEF